MTDEPAATPQPVLGWNDEGPVSFSQEYRLREYPVDEAGDPMTYEHLVDAFELIREPDASLIRSAAATVAARQAAMRTSFYRAEAGWMQRIEPPGVVDVVEVDLSANSDEALRSAIDTWAAAPVSRREGRPVRFLLVRAPNRSALAIAADHLIMDGWAFGILCRELTAVYEAEMSGTHPNLPDLPFRYLDYAIWMRRRYEAGRLDSQIDYWIKRLRGVEDTGTFPFPAKVGFATAISVADSLCMDLDPDFVRQLRVACKARRITPFVAVLSAVALATHTITGSRDLLFPNYFPNRRTAGVEHLIGWFATTLFLRLSLPESVTVDAAVAEARSAVLEAVSRDDLSFMVFRNLLPRAFARPPSAANITIHVDDTGSRENRESALALAPSRRLEARRPITLGRIAIDCLLNTSRPQLTATYERGRYATDLIDDLLRETQAALALIGAVGPSTSG